jgi:hypothetical protein
MTLGHQSVTAWVRFADTRGTIKERGDLDGSPGEGGSMNSAEPVRPAIPQVREVKASVLAAFQLVEDARYLGSERRTHRERSRLMVERTVASRRLARDLLPS